MVLAASDPTLLGIAAIITSVAGVITTWIGARKSAKDAKEEAEEECRNRLASTRKEAEDCAEELHKLKMERANEG